MRARHLQLTWYGFIVFVVATVAVLAFTPAARARAAANALSIVGGILLAGTVGYWLWRRRQAGKRLLTLEPLSGSDIAVLALFAGLILGTGDAMPHDLLFVVIAWIAFGTVQILGRLQACTHGLIRGSRFLPWSQVVSYALDEPTPPGETTTPGRWWDARRLTIQYHSGSSRGLRTVTVRYPPDLQADIARVLAQHAPSREATGARYALQGRRG